MAFQHKPGSGSLFTNDRKTQDSHPDYTGTLVGLDGKEYWLSAWNKTGQRGPFFSLSIKPKDAAVKPATPTARPAATAARRPAPTSPPTPEPDDDVPF